jgi:hypothetical protein
MPNRRTPEPTIVCGLARRLLVFELPDQLALCFMERVSDVRAIGNRYQRRTTGQTRAQRDALFFAAAVLQGDLYVHIVRIPPSQMRHERRQCFQHMPALLRHEPRSYTYYLLGERIAELVG